MVDGFGTRKTKSGLIINERDGTEEAIRPRWFQVTHAGPENHDVGVGDYVLVAHGRWSRGFNIDSLDETRYYHLDTEEIFGISDTNPLEE